MATLSLERLHLLCFNQEVMQNEATVPSAPSAPAKVISFSDLRLSHSMNAASQVLLEYEDWGGRRTLHEVSLTCSGEGVDGAIYLGGVDGGKFSVFRADCIRRVTVL